MPPVAGLGGGVGLSSLGLSPANPGSGRLRACVEAVLVNALMTSLLEELTTQQMATSFLQVEMPVQILLACMELNGFGRLHFSTSFVFLYNYLG